ncbi:lymphocyte antigen 6 complex locus protein G6d-like [Lampris incognitus]|uniref:lymphocyte antigen 6 complex locus protein G6d-like n=1 Tax=Lampris incognitus TaxID=2546036 RepID=UPI0024B55BE9|nr:lymphocyte antigen 6 complex locus protein G6d-like [Lampris incognitus]
MHVHMLGTGLDESLTCKSYKLGIAGTCLFSSTQTCSDSEPNCYCVNLAFSVNRDLNFPVKSCLATKLCNQTDIGTILITGYTISRTCCSTDLCNAASPLCLALTAVLNVLPKWH